MSRRLVLLLLAAWLGATATTGAAAAPVPPAPIPQDPGASTVAPFLGHARPARPVPFGPRAPRHPFMAPNWRSNLHDDAYQSDAYPYAGPLGYQPEVRSTFFAHECASVTFDSRGRIVTVCVGIEAPVVMLLDPHSLQTLASYPLPPRQASTVTNLFTSFGGGGYFYLDDHDRVVVPTTDQHLYVLAEAGPTFRKVADYDLSPAVGSSVVVSALPDWSGRIWFASQDGVVGYVDPKTGRLASRDLGEPIGNSFAVDETGGVFVVTDDALYRFDASSRGPVATWRVRYDHGSRVKPGQTEHGSGTTPTIVRRGGHHYVVITDNAEPRMHLLVYRADKSGPGRRPVCSTPLFPAGRSATDNSVITVGDAVVVENNYGYTGPEQRPPGVEGPYRPTPTTVPDVTRVDVDYAHGGCRVAWTAHVRVPTSVSKASAAAGLVYVYEHPATGDVHYRDGRPSQPEDPWYLTALDLRTGHRVWSQLTGTGLGYNNNYAPITLGPDGTAYVGVLGGLVSVRDTARPPGR